MRKQKQGRKFSRPKNQRQALLYGLVKQLFLKERLKTTLSRAKEARRLAEKFISKSRQQDLAAKRYLIRFLGPKVSQKLMGKISPRYKLRPGGYTRIIKLPPRRSDGAEMAIIELV